MKKICIYIVCLFLLISTVACEKRKNDDNSSLTENSETEDAGITEEITEEPTTAISDYSTYSNELNAWWIKRNTEHGQSGAQDKIDLSQYEAYYVNPTADDKVIYLTFDCGYENGYTECILDTLRRHNATAAFFVTQTYIRDDTDLVKRMKDEGHMVCNHTITHPSMPGKDIEFLKNEINGCDSYMYEATGYKMDKYLRPPKGEYSERTLQLTKDMGYKTVFWSMTHMDYLVNNQPSKEHVVEHFEKYHHPGAITLLHNVSSANASALDDILTLLEQEGYRFGSLDELSY